MVTANGYARQEYGQRAVNGLGTSINLSAGSAVKDLSISLTPTGTVSGRMVDEDGQPAVDAPVQLLRVAYTPQGRTFQAAGTTAADDRGEYRLYGMKPGSYYLSAGNAPGPLRSAGQRGFGNRVSPTIYAFNFYPGVADVAQASLIEVKSGSETTADMRLQRQQGRRVRGRIIDSRTGQPPASVSVSLGYRSLGGGGGSYSSGPSYDRTNGTFELQNVIPGKYTIQAQVQEPNQFGPQFGPVTDPATFVAREAALAARPSAELPIEVANADIEGLVLALKTGASLRGRVTVEGPGASPLPNLQQLRIGFRPSADGLVNVPGGVPAVGPIGPDGTFQIAGLKEGEYVINYGGVPEGFYVKSARLDGEDVLADTFKFSGSASGTLSVVISGGAARVNGVVTDAKNQAVPGAQVILIPAQRNRMDLYRTAFADPSGQFTITGITPSDYKLFSWDGLELYRYLDLDFMKRFESDGRPVRAAESSTQTVDAKLIPPVQ
jgi:hypothetical protein